MTQGLTIYKAVTGDTLLSLQVHQKRPGCPTCDNSFLALQDFTHPFMFTRVASSNVITEFTVRGVDDAVVETLDNDLIKIVNAGAVDYIYCNFQALGATLECGLYYYNIEADTEVYYSDLFRVVNKTVDFSTSDIAVNGDFATDLSGWTVDGATWDSGGGGRASIGALGDSIAQTAPGTGMVKIIVTVLSTFTTGMEFNFGINSYVLAPGVNTYYVPSGIVYTILNNDDVDFNALTVESVVINQAYKVECYNLIVARNSCNKNNIPYLTTGYSDVFIFDGELSEPEYPRNDDFVEDGNKDKSLTFLKIDKRWTLSSTEDSFEPLVDELNKLPSNDCIYIFNDVWKKEFTVFESTMDLEIRTVWDFEDKCNAALDLVINETLATKNGCCEEITDLECCLSFTYELDETEANVWEITITSSCPGMRYYLMTLDGAGDLVGETEFTGSITIDIDIAIDDFYSLKGSKFGCDDIIYELNLS